jgi:hypothetical protein
VSTQVEQKSERLLGCLEKELTLQDIWNRVGHVRPLIPMFRRAFSKVDLPTFGIPMTRTLSSIA